MSWIDGIVGQNFRHVPGQGRNREDGICYAGNCCELEGFAPCQLCGATEAPRYHALGHVALCRPCAEQEATAHHHHG